MSGGFPICFEGEEVSEVSDGREGDWYTVREKGETGEEADVPSKMLRSHSDLKHRRRVRTARVQIMS
jgi:hypothetical protein